MTPAPLLAALSHILIQALGIEFPSMVHTGLAKGAREILLAAGIGLWLMAGGGGGGSGRRRRPGAPRLSDRRTSRRRRPARGRRTPPARRSRRSRRPVWPGRPLAEPVLVQRPDTDAGGARDLEQRAVAGEPAQQPLPLGETIQGAVGHSRPHRRSGYHSLPPNRDSRRLPMCICYIAIYGPR